MSIKFYNLRKVNSPVEFMGNLKKIQRECQESIRLGIIEHMKFITKEENLENIIEHDYKRFNELKEFYIAEMLDWGILSRYFYFSLVVYFRPVRGGKFELYINPIGIEEITWDWCEILKNYDTEDFHYQNQTDKPDRISTKEWKKREKITEELYLNCGRLELRLFDYVNLSPTDLRYREYVKK